MWFIDALIADPPLFRARFPDTLASLLQLHLDCYTPVSSCNAANEQVLLIMLLIIQPLTDSLEILFSCRFRIVFNQITGSEPDNVIFT